MIYIFDLDDTLYNERQFVESGFLAVAKYAEFHWGLNHHDVFNQLVALLDENGRGTIFNDLLKRYHLENKKNIQKCVTTYRLHKPKLSMPKEHLALLTSLPAPLYLVTDGHKIVQNNKIEALEIAHLFKRVFITHRFGIKHAKPSPYCFKKIQQAENCAWEDMVYIGDNPTKDFVNLNKLGMQTVRVLTGVHKAVNVSASFNAKITINKLTDLANITFR